MSTALTLCVWVNGVKHPLFHITVGMLNNPAAKKTVIDQFKGYFGSSNVFKLVFVQKWGQNSILTKSWNPTTNLGLETIRIQMIDFINQKFPGSLDTSRYTQQTLDNFVKQFGPTETRVGMSPQHIDTKGDQSYIGQTIDVTYSLS